MYKILNRLFVFIVFIAVSISSGAEQKSSMAEQAFEMLKALKGTWKVKGSDSDFRIQFSTTANETTLVESWLSKGKTHSLTLYHLNGDMVMATHYCPQGNQPRLQMKKFTPNENIEFEFLDVTNLESAASSHQHYLGFEFTSPQGSLRRTEAYRSGRESKKDSLSLVKLP